MPVRPTETLIHVEGGCGPEDALPLLEALQALPPRPVALAECVHLHTAVLQVLMAVRPAVETLPAEPFLARWVVPVLKDER
ncbi:hypothetical protein [Pararhodospirillum oryzae]|uniref:Uncharacterized protein n=1 Tax=Pararhodospirillum oryzae TaxID=478448 RepID=A0A512H7A3_9PROT|nr:hypothetical protein [Pararhodospirillum oryzae]GEO81336.1 hypothetical protein ROR02_14670 [Pararhodospirillum oryzae]